MKIFDLREKNIGILEITIFCYLKLKTKQNTEKVLKILTSRQMLQKLPISIAEVKVDNTSENLLNQIRQTNHIVSGSRKRNCKKVYNNIMNTIRL